MRAREDNVHHNNESNHGIFIGNDMGFEFRRRNGAYGTYHRRTVTAKSTPSKWDDAQKWIFGKPKGGDKGQSKIKHRDSNADDLRLIASEPQKEHAHSYGGDKGIKWQGENGGFLSAMSSQGEAETKKIQCDEPIWRIYKPLENCKLVVRSVCVRDMGTEMTPIASQEPSRTATPVRATTPVLQSPISSGSSTPPRTQQEMQATVGCPQTGLASTRTTANMDRYQRSVRMNSMETRAMDWDQAERAKHMARYKREEVRIQAWETREKRRAESEMRKMEKKAEEMKACAQEMLADRLATTGRIADQKRANAEARLYKKSARTSEKADYIRRTGHLPSSFFFFKFPSQCW